MDGPSELARLIKYLTGLYLTSTNLHPRLLRNDNGFKCTSIKGPFKHYSCKFVAVLLIFRLQLKLVRTVFDSFDKHYFFFCHFIFRFLRSRAYAKSSSINTRHWRLNACMCTAPLGPTPITSLNPMGHIKSSLYILISLPTQPIPHLNTFLQNHPTRETEYYSIFSLPHFLAFIPHFQLWPLQLNFPPLWSYYVSSNS